MSHIMTIKDFCICAFHMQIPKQHTCTHTHNSRINLNGFSEEIHGNFACQEEWEHLSAHDTFHWPEISEIVGKSQDRNMKIYENVRIVDGKFVATRFCCAMRC